MEGISLFGATPCLGVIPAGGFIIPASYITNDAPSVASEILMPKEVHTQGFVGSESATNSGVTPKTYTTAYELKALVLLWQLHSLVANTWII